MLPVRIAFYGFTYYILSQLLLDTVLLYDASSYMFSILAFYFRSAEKTFSSWLTHLEVNISHTNMNREVSNEYGQKAFDN